jgi:very-short-patch-repair endonuclease
MILDKKVKIKITKKNINHYKVFFENISLKDIIEIDVENHLQSGSNIKLNVSCDICGIKRFIGFNSYNKNINSNSSYKIYTCDKCSHIKLKDTNLKKYGVEYYSKHPERNDKVKKTCNERYGSEHFSKTDEYKERVSKTNLEKFGYENPFMDNEMIKKKFKEKYGVEHPSQVPEIYEKIKKSNLIKTGYESPLSSPKIREDVRKNNIEMWGVDHHMKTEYFKEILKNTNLEKYGVKHIFQSMEIRGNIKKTNLDKWGTDNPIKSDILRKKYMQIANDPNYVNYIGESYSKFKCSNGHDFNIHVDNYHSRKKNNIPLCTICNPIGDSISIKEDELFEFIKSNYDQEIIQSYRDGIEIDIYLPDLNIGFEFNGLYWHSEEYKDKNYHLNKSNYFNTKGIRIIHIWEDDWDNKKDIVKSMILNMLKRSKSKLYARNCYVKLIDVQTDNLFLDNNHIQGKDSSNVKLGLYYNDLLVSVMTFNKLEGRKKLLPNEYNLSRFCNIVNYNVVGGASKLLNYFINNYKPTRIISYADKDWSIGSLYYSLEFSLVSESVPDYKYVIENKRKHKQNFKKSILKIDNSITERQHMLNMGFYRIWDCGKMKFERLF